MTIDGSYSRSGFHQMFDESLRYVGLRMQDGVPVVDADLNDVSDSVLFQLRRVIQRSIGTGAPYGNDGFKISQASSPANNFKVTGGDGTDEGSGQIFVGGLPCRLNSDVDYVSTSIDIHPQVAARTDTVLTDDTANYTVNELAGRDLVPDIDSPGTTITIISNTATTITVASGLNAATSVGKYYRVNLTTPGGSRADEVYLDVFLDEVSSDEDANLIHSLGGGPTPTPAAFRLIVRQLVKVIENGSAPSGTYTDGLGRLHFYQKIAVLDRTATANVNTSMISDSRPVVARSRGDELLASVSGINGLSVANTSLYIPPVDKTVKVSKLVLTAETVTGVSSIPRVRLTVGGNEIFAAQDLDGFTTAGNYWVFNAQGLMVPATGGQTIQIEVVSAGVGTTLDFQAELFGQES